MGIYYKNAINETKHIDVHKTFVVACIASTNKQGVTTYKRHRFSAFTQGLKELLQWLLDNNCMPPADIRQLRDLMRCRYKLTCFMSSEKNRLQNCLTVSNIQLASVVSDTFGKSSQRILDKILENPIDTSFDIEPLIHGSLKKKLSQLELAIDGFITPEQAGKLKVIKEHYENLESRKAELGNSISHRKMACLPYF